MRVTPFRSTRTTVDPSAAAPAVRDAVEHMVRQFADPLAFYRELVQNSLDAGATAIDVRLTFESLDEDHGLARIVVSDDGCGMDRATIERCLLVLFRSSKDADATKIGKFGVGFFSVFAVAPEAVLVDTARGDVGFRVTLLPDHTYEIVKSSPRKGTAITLRVPMEVPEFGPFVDRSLAAVRRWCEHIAVPLVFVAQRVALDPDERRDDDLIEARIDRAFGFGAPIEVHSDTPGLQLAVTVGDPEGALFYKRGLLLHETQNALVQGVRFKAQSDELGHTISRDDVKRDRHFDRIVAKVKSVAERSLGPAIEQALNGATQAWADVRSAGGDAGPAARHLAAVAQLAGKSTATLRQGRVRWPLCAPVEDRGSKRWSKSFSSGVLSSNPVLYASRPSRLTEALAGLGHAVIDTGALGCTEHSESPPDVISKMFWMYLWRATSAFGLAEPCSEEALSETEIAILKRATRLLEQIGIRNTALAQFSGAVAERLTLAVDDWHSVESGTPLVVAARDADRRATSFRGSGCVWINRAHDVWEAACAAAERDTPFAALCVARSVSLIERRLDERTDERLLSRSTAEEVAE